ncbi:MAG: NAD-dependent epimerase/dehydratase family protein [Myxococcota bacterium]
MSIAFVTGATGFIGGRLVRALEDGGRFDRIHCLVRNPAQSGLMASGKIRVFRGDVTDPVSLRPAMESCGAAFHLAAWYELGIPRSAIPRMEAINIDGTRNVLTLARELEIPRTVYVSTAYAIGATGDQTADETFEHRGRFTCEYERTKLEAHRVAQRLARDGLPLVTVLPGAVYGEGDPSLIGDTFSRLARGTFPALIAGSEESALTYVHVDDVVRGILLALEKGRLGESYILAGEVMRFGEMVRCITDLAASKPPRLTVPLWLARGMAFLDERFSRLRGRKPLISRESLASLLCSFAVSSEKAREELGFRPRPNREGFAQTLRWIKETVQTASGPSSPA